MSESSNKTQPSVTSQLIDNPKESVAATGIKNKVTGVIPPDEPKATVKVAGKIPTSENGNSSAVSHAVPMPAAAPKVKGVIPKDGSGSGTSPSYAALVNPAGSTDNNGDQQSADLSIIDDIINTADTTFKAILDFYGELPSWQKKALKRFNFFHPIIETGRVAYNLCMGDYAKAGEIAEEHVTDILSVLVAGAIVTAIIGGAPVTIPMAIAAAIATGVGAIAIEDSARWASPKFFDPIFGPDPDDEQPPQKRTDENKKSTETQAKALEGAIPRPSSVTFESVALPGNRPPLNDSKKTVPTNVKAKPPLVGPPKPTKLNSKPVVKGATTPTVSKAIATKRSTSKPAYNNGISSFVGPPKPISSKIISSGANSHSPAIKASSKCSLTKDSSPGESVSPNIASSVSGDSGIHQNNDPLPYHAGSNPFDGESMTEGGSNQSENLTGGDVYSNPNQTAQAQTYTPPDSLDSESLPGKTSLLRHGNLALPLQQGMSNKASLQNYKAPSSGESTGIARKIGGGKILNSFTQNIQEASLSRGGKQPVQRAVHGDWLHASGEAGSGLTGMTPRIGATAPTMKNGGLIPRHMMTQGAAQASQANSSADSLSENQLYSSPSSPSGINPPGGGFQVSINQVVNLAAGATAEGLDATLTQGRDRLRNEVETIVRDMFHRQRRLSFGSVSA